MQIAVLGPLEVRDDSGRVLGVAGARLRSLLARLAIDAGRPVGIGTLIEAVWGEHPPAESTNALQTLVSRLRRILGSNSIGQSDAGYRLVAASDDVDAHRFERLVADGLDAARRGDAAATARLLRAAQDLWRGQLTDGLEADESIAARLGDLRRIALVERLEAELNLGGGAELLADLESAVQAYPLDERLAGQLVRALALAGRQADALGHVDLVRGRLADELGVDPSAELQAIHLAVLRGEYAPPERSFRPPRRTNLKAQLTSFVGREGDLARIQKCLEENRLVTLVGPGGAGKTRLASEAAAGVDARDGVWFAELAPLTDGAGVAQAVLSALGLREVHLLERGAVRTARGPLDRLIDTLADKQSVVVLDNCEHLIDAAAELAAVLLGQCSELRILTTSREPLGITGETILPVPPLGQPGPDTPAVDAVEYPAVRLFADRANAVRPGFEVDHRTVGAVVEIVRRLDGLPLAIELAAARLRTIALEDVADRLSDRFRLLTGGSRTVLPRHRTLRAVVEWSWELLTPAERVLAERLAVFPSGVTVESARAVCADDRVPSEDVPDLLASLVDKSLLQPVGSGQRMRMLETIREYGSDRLGEQGELFAVRRRHADHFAALLSAAQDHLVSREQLPWFDLLGAERGNLVAALRCRCDAGDAAGALRVAIELGGYSMMIGNNPDVAQWMADALSVPGEVDDELRWIARAVYATNAVTSGTAPEVEGEQPFDLKDIAERIVTVDLDVHPMIGLLKSVVAFFSGDRELTMRCLEEGLHAGSAWSRAAVRMLRASFAENDGDVEAMRRDADQALREFRALGERWGTASTLRAIGQLRTLDGDLAGAFAAYEEALALMREVGSREDEGFLLLALADLLLRQGHGDEARAYVTEAQHSAELTGSRIETVFALMVLADLERHAGNLDRARQLQRELAQWQETMPQVHPAHGHAAAIVSAAAAELALADGDRQAVPAHAREAYRAGVASKDLPLLANVGVTLADIAVEVDLPATAAEMLGAAARIRGADDRTALSVSRLRATLCERLGESEFQRAYDHGRALDRLAAIDCLDPDRWIDRVTE